MAKEMRKTDNMVKIRAPFGRPNEQDLIIGINGVNYSIPKDGQEHEVPDYVAYEFERAQAAEQAFYAKQAELQGNSIFA